MVTTMRDLEARSQSEKLKTYRAFSKVLGIALVSSFLFELYRVYFVNSGTYLKRWTLIWFFDGGFSELVFCVMLLLTMFLWRPREHGRAYAHVEQVPSSPIDEFGLEMKQTGEIEE